MPKKLSQPTFTYPQYWQDHIIFWLLVTTPALMINFKDRPAILLLLLLPIFIFYPFSQSEKKQIISYYRSPVFICFILFITYLTLTLLLQNYWLEMPKNNWYPKLPEHLKLGDYFSPPDIFLHGLVVALRLSWIWLIFPPLIIWLRQNNNRRQKIFHYLTYATIFTVIIMLIMIELGLKVRDNFRNDQFSQNATIMLLILLPLLAKQKLQAWIAALLLLVLHIPIFKFCLPAWLTIGTIAECYQIGYGTARLWTLAIGFAFLCYFIYPHIIKLNLFSRKILAIIIIIGYIGMMLILMATAFFYNPNNPTDSWLLHFLNDLGFNSTSIKERLRIWHFAWGHIIEQPILGYGINSMRYLPPLNLDISQSSFPFNFFISLPNEYYYINWPHFVWLELILDAGLLAPWFLFAASGFFIYYLLVRVKEFEQYYNPHFATVFFLTFLFSFFITNSFYALWQNCYLMIGMALLMSESPYQKSSQLLSFPYRYPNS